MIPATMEVPSGESYMEVGFAKLQGEDFEYYMQTYSIILGRNSKKSIVDLDLASLGGGMNISRHHARIFYDFQYRCFALEVLGKKGCLVKGVLHLPGNPPLKLKSQDLLQIGEKEFYFLLPVRNILGGALVARQGASSNLSPVEGSGPYVGGSRKGRTQEYFSSQGGDEDGDCAREEARRYGDSGCGSVIGDYGYGIGNFEKGVCGALEKKSDGRSRVDPEADNQQLQLLEEKDVVSSIANVLSDTCGPGEWMPMEKLHAALMEQYGDVWHHSRVRRYLTSEDWPGPEAKGKPWYGLLVLLRKYPEHFVINTRSKGGRVTLEFVSLVSLLS